MVISLWENLHAVAFMNARTDLPALDTQWCMTWGADLYNGAPGAEGRVPHAVPGRVASGLQEQADGAVPPGRPATCSRGSAPD